MSKSNRFYETVRNRGCFRLSKQTFKTTHGDISGIQVDFHSTYNREAFNYSCVIDTMLEILAHEAENEIN